MSYVFHVLCSGFALDGHDELRLAAVAETGDTLQLIGTANVRSPDQVAATIYQLHVVNGWRGRGVGRAIVEKACKESKELGAVAMSAVVEEGGPVAFWSHMGFSPVHVDGKQMLVSCPLSER